MPIISRHAENSTVWGKTEWLNFFQKIRIKQGISSSDYSAALGS